MGDGINAGFGTLVIFYFSLMFIYGMSLGVIEAYIIEPINPNPEIFELIWFVSLIAGFSSWGYFAGVNQKTKKEIKEEEQEEKESAFSLTNIDWDKD